MKKSDARPGIQDLLDAIRGVFKKYSREAREKSWRDVTTGEGLKAVHKMIRDPGVPIISPYRFQKFKEWLGN